MPATTETGAVTIDRHLNSESNTDAERVSKNDNDFFSFFHVLFGVVRIIGRNKTRFCIRAHSDPPSFNGAWNGGMRRRQRCTFGQGLRDHPLAGGSLKRFHRIFVSRNSNDALTRLHIMPAIAPLLQVGQIGVVDWYSVYRKDRSCVQQVRSACVCSASVCRTNSMTQIHAIEQLKASREPLATNRAEALNVESTETDWNR